MPRVQTSQAASDGAAGPVGSDTQIVLKLQAGDEIRRVVLPLAQVVTLSLPRLRSLIDTAFPHLTSTPVIPLLYKDEDGDWVSLSHESDLAGLVHMVQHGAMTKLVIKTATGVATSLAPPQTPQHQPTSTGPPMYVPSMQAPPVTNAPDPTLPQPVPPTGSNRVHQAVCDGCEMWPIVGRRFRCQQCPDYDLCSGCHMRRVHAKMYPGHQLRELHLDRPRHVPSGNRMQVHPRTMCDGCEMWPIVGLRFHCQQCTDYDLCDRCHHQRRHAAKFPSHVMLCVPPPSDDAVVAKPPAPVPRKCASASVKDDPCSSAAPTAADAEPHTACAAPTAAVSAPAEPLAVFLGDVTIPDGQVMEPATEFVKTWRVRTSCLPDGALLSFVGGDLCSAPLAVRVPTPCPDTGEVDVSVPMTAPSTAGQYRNDWRFITKDGVRFGDRLWLDVVVEPAVHDSFVMVTGDSCVAGSPPTPLPTADAAPNPTADAAPAPAADAAPAPTADAAPAPPPAPPALQPGDPAASEPAAPAQQLSVSDADVDNLAAQLEIMGFTVTQDIRRDLQSRSIETVIADLLDRSTS